MNSVRSILGPALSGAAFAAMAAGPGISPAPEATWTRWQARVGIGSSVSLVGDYYFSARSAAALPPSGFRATSGLIVGARPSAWTAHPAAETTTSPYLGVGYGGVFGRSGWNLSADLGLMALEPAQAVKFGRVFNGAQLDDALRELRLAPIVQLGVSYAF